MTVSVNVSSELAGLAEPYAAAENRSIAQQIEYWARLGKAATDNPELPLQFLKETILAMQQAKDGQVAPYSFGSGE
jgi:hypothetical protein